jgi:hypothetical protein
MMYSLISAAVPVDEIRISEFSVDAAPAGELAMRSLGAAPDKTGAAGAGHEAQMLPQASARRVYVDDRPASARPPRWSSASSRCCRQTRRRTAGNSIS